MEYGSTCNYLREKVLSYHENIGTFNTVNTSVKTQTVTQIHNNKNSLTPIILMLSSICLGKKQTKNNIVLRITPSYNKQFHVTQEIN